MFLLGIILVIGITFKCVFIVRCIGIGMSTALICVLTLLFVILAGVTWVYFAFWMADFVFASWLAFLVLSDDTGKLAVDDDDGGVCRHTVDESLWENVQLIESSCAYDVVEQKCKECGQKRIKRFDAVSH